MLFSEETYGILVSFYIYGPICKYRDRERERERENEIERKIERKI
jgi:hypothetical protein